MDGLTVNQAMDSLTVRFMETERYDPMIDSEVIRFMGITNTGTYTAEVPVYGPASIRKYRQEFKEWVIGCMENGTPPCEGEFD